MQSTCVVAVQSVAVNCSFSDNVTPLVVTFILLAMVHIVSVDTFQSCMGWLAILLNCVIWNTFLIN